MARQFSGICAKSGNWKTSGNSKQEKGPAQKPSASSAGKGLTQVDHLEKEPQKRYLRRRSGALGLALAAPGVATAKTAHAALAVLEENDLVGVLPPAIFAAAATAAATASAATALAPASTALAATTPTVAALALEVHVFEFVQLVVQDSWVDHGELSVRTGGAGAGAHGAHAEGEEEVGDLAGHLGVVLASAAAASSAAFAGARAAFVACAALGAGAGSATTAGGLARAAGCASGLFAA